MTNAFAALGGPIPVFVSYSHDSPEHLQRVLELSNKLLSQGIDCHIDQYETSPAAGWPAWMNVQIERARFVLVVCTEVYARRVGGQEQPGQGLGAVWEGAIITQALYESGGQNKKFIPIIFAASDAAFVPQFLRAFTRYDVSTSDDHDKLYRHLTSQPRVIKPPVGQLQVMPAIGPSGRQPVLGTTPPTTTASATQQHVLLMSLGGNGTYFVPLNRAESGDRTVLQVAPVTSAQSAFLTKLSRHREDQVGAAFGLSAFLGRLKNATQEYKAGQEEWTLTLASETTDYGSGFMEMSTFGYSADQIAEMRARRILLNDARPVEHSSGVELANDAMLEVLVRGLNTPLQVVASPLPDLFAKVGDEEEIFLTSARLLLILYLRLSGVVEHVLRLNLSFSARGTLLVDFEGERAKKYSNVAPPSISVRGTCILRKPTSA